MQIKGFAELRVVDINSWAAQPGASSKNGGIDDARNYSRAPMGHITNFALSDHLLKCS